MKPTAIIYSSNTGFTARYAALLSAATGLPAYPLQEAERLKGARVIYLGWLMAGTVKDLGRARRRYDLAAVIGVGLGAPEAQSVRKACRIPEETAVFTLQGGMAHAKLTGVYASMIRTLTTFLQKKKNRTPDEDEMLRLLMEGGDFVRAENLHPVLAWFEMQ